MISKQKVGIFEAILFASGDAVEIDKISEILNIGQKETKEIIDFLDQKYNDKYSGINLVFIENKIQFCSNSNYVEPVRAVLDLKRNITLSSAAMEVLSLIAYNQPVTKAFVEQVRGVDCSGVVNSLSQKSLICEVGRLDLPGRPLIYGTTDNFLRCFSLKTIDDLPKIEGLSI